ncbi:MAG: zf-HC2 domain-containing protein [Candidatus Sericytochromatia bacterium]|nr:zf-HC2 domain-containing protein [Candidatus Sericytochromatia bacterium]
MSAPVRPLSPSSPPAVPPAIWNAFLQQHAPVILAAVLGWCQDGCRVSRTGYACVLRVVASAAPERAEAPDHCDEGLALFTWVSRRLRERLPQRLGLASEVGWLRAQLLDLRLVYLGLERGRLILPAALAEASPDAQAVFRLSCRHGDRAHVGRVLGLGAAAIDAAEHEVRARLALAGLAWWPWGAATATETWLPLEPLCDRGEEVAAWLEGALSPEAQVALARHVDACAACRSRQAALEVPTDPAAEVAVPAWVLRSALDRSESDAPEPESALKGWRSRLMTQPDWLAGLVVGGVGCVFLLLVVLPRQEYAKPVTAPDDEVLAVAATPLSEPLARQLADARRQLRRGQVDAALQNLNGVLARRPDEQEARWLLASTYDRLGDAARAAKHYRVYLHVHDRREAIEDSRAKRIRKRLGQWQDDAP